MLSRITEPVLVIVAGGTTLVQAIIHLFAAFGHPVTPEQEAAITTVTSLILAAIARTQVIPTTFLSPEAVADAAATKAGTKPVPPPAPPAPPQP